MYTVSVRTYLRGRKQTSSGQIMSKPDSSCQRSSVSVQRLMASEAKAYLYGKNIPQLFESLMTSLMIERPEDPIAFLETCLAEIRSNNLTSYDWRTFNQLIVKKEETMSMSSRESFAATEPLPPIGAGQDLSEAEKQDIKENCQNEIGDKHVIFVLGGPGSGKGTQCARIAEEFEFKHISAGDLLREEVAKATEEGVRIKEIMEEGKLVPPEITVTLLKQAILSNKEAKGFLIDGFPRDLPQGKIFEEQVCEGSMVLVFECSDDVMMERLLERGKNSERVDDNEDTIRERLQTHQQSTIPVIEHFHSLGKVRKVDAGRTVDEVFADVQKIFREITSQSSSQLIVESLSISFREAFAATEPLPPIGAGQDLPEAEKQEKTENCRNEICDKHVIFVLGGPGSGKGTQCARIVEKFEFKHISAGDLLREEVAKATEEGARIKEMMEEGKLVPPEITVTLLKQAILSNKEAKGFLIDGFPRDLPQGKIFEEQVCEGSMVLVFECSDDVMMERLLERGKNSERVDDNEDTIRKRLQTHQQSTIPVIEHFQSLGKVRKVDAGRTVDEVFVDVQEIFTEITSQSSSQLIIKKKESMSMNSKEAFAATEPLPPIGAGQDLSEAGNQDIKENCQNEIGDKLVIFVLGGPGSGKGTQCARIVEEFEFKHISAGDLLREEVAKATEEGARINEIMEKGKLVPPEIIVTLLKQAILSNKEAKGFLIDGFPRDLPQGKIFEEQVCEGSMVLVFECSDDVMMERLLERGKNSERVDDNKDTIRERLQTHQQSTIPVIEHFHSLGKVRKVDAGRTVDEVFADVQKIFREITSQSND